VFPAPCVDDSDSLRVDKSEYLEGLLGVPNLWPMHMSERMWTEETFYGLIEVFHDLVARPRSRYLHDYMGCGWHYSDFAIDPARRLYRWRVNRLLGRSPLPLRLAEEGEDVGRLVVNADDARADLTALLLRTSEPTAAERVRHAIALYRERGASIENKRSAVIAMAGVLEERRKLLQQELLSKDEDALFQIANQFSIRHHHESQRADYGEMFLDWIFWWYAATVELTNQLIARSGK
jgi:hypothetical protein